MVKKCPEYDTKTFILAQLNAIDKSKFIESQKICRDLYFNESGKHTQDFYNWWIKKHAKGFRDAWHNSICRWCSNVGTCKNCLKTECKNFSFNLQVEIKKEV